MPGPWADPGQLISAVGKANSGYQIQDEWLIHEASGFKASLFVTEPDDEIADVFAGTGRLSKLIDEIAAHKVKVHLMLQGDRWKRHGR